MLVFGFFRNSKGVTAIDYMPDLEYLLNYFQSGKFSCFINIYLERWGFEVLALYIII